MGRGRKRKCHQCGVTDSYKDEMEVIVVGEKSKQEKCYHKGKCWDDYLADKAFKEKEQIEKDKLNETIKEIYGIKNSLETPAWVLLQKLRDGVPITGKQPKEKTKRYKEGYEWDLIRKTFEYCSETIEYYNATKNFNGFLTALRYALTIIIDKIYIVEQREMNKKRQEKMIEKHIEKVEEDSFSTSYKKPSKSNADISSFLDD